MNLRILRDARQTNANRDAEYLKASYEYPNNFYLKLAAKAVKMQSTASSKKDMRVETNVLGNDVVVSNRNGVFTIGINGKPAFLQKGFSNLVENMVLGILDKEYADDIYINRPEGRTVDSERREWSKMEKEGYSLPFDKLLAIKAKDTGGKTKGTNYRKSPWLNDNKFKEALSKDPELGEYFFKVKEFPLYLSKSKSLTDLRNKTIIMPDGKQYPLDGLLFERILTSPQIDEIYARNKNLRISVPLNKEQYVAVTDDEVYRIYLDNNEWVFTQLNLHKK